ncbi:hypothetical protein MAIT1_00739 [Magnetofaba australis IT-1]|uniref:Lipo-like protein n=1 Tax=Magnetofaba australis IT-1 TaxID=1434232 RepID=A0A1Y2K1Q9_9PROT|nr:hypothetical protein MAIT1_00739 [Magnetofaba australis IT-1]
MCNFDRLRSEVRPGDVLLAEGASRVGQVIKTITQSTWSHSALYIGRLRDIHNPQLRARVMDFFDGDEEEPLLVEALLGRGVVITPLETYRGQHLRISRPKGLLERDVHRVIAFAIRRLGADYDIRQILDLMRFLFPYSIIPGRWRSSLFSHRAGKAARTVCSTMLAEAFTSVRFPITPIIRPDANGKMRLFRRNERLVTPRDFDHSPYFEVVKYPLVEAAENYRDLPWDTEGWVCNEHNECYLPTPDVEAETGKSWNPLGWASNNMKRLARRRWIRAIRRLRHGYRAWLWRRSHALEDDPHAGLVRRIMAHHGGATLPPPSFHRREKS